MMQTAAHMECGDKPHLAEEIMLGIDPVHLSVTLQGEQHQFSNKGEMEDFLRNLWEQQIAC